MIHSSNFSFPRVPLLPPPGSKPAYHIARSHDPNSGAAMHRLFGVLLVLATPLFLNAGDDDKDKELKSLEGKWKAVSLEAGGKPLPKEVVPEFLFTVGAKGK